MTMSIGTICTRDVVMVDVTKTLKHAAPLMREHHVGALLVFAQTEEGPRAVGLVTDRDLAIEAMARGLGGDEVKVGQVVSGPPVTVHETASLDEAIEAMQGEGVRRLLVTTAEARLAGIVSLDDLLEALAARMVRLAEAVRGGLARESAQRVPLPTMNLGEIRLPPLQSQQANYQTAPERTAPGADRSAWRPD